MGPILTQSEVMMKRIQSVKNFLVKRKKITIISGVILILIIIAWQFFTPKQSSVQYQTAQVTKGTLVVSVSESGTVALANRQAVTTQASGVVSEVDVKDGDVVTQGQTIAKLVLDQQGQQRSTSAWASYLNAQNTVAADQANLNTLQTTLFKTNQAFLSDRGVINPSIQQQADPVYIEENATWLAAEAAYKNQQNVIAAAQAAESSAWYTYEQTSNVIIAPQNGVISDLVIAPGMQISSPTSTTANASQTVANIKTEGNPIITVSLSEIDAVKVKTGQRATITFDALPNETFTGKVLGINTTGSVSSGVTTYPATIILDTPNDTILPNMSTTANIITDVKTDVLLVPSSAVTTSNGQATVTILQNNNPAPVAVTTGESSDTETEITSGLTEGQTIIVGGLSSGTGASSATSSPFSSGLRLFGGGGGAVRVAGGGGGGPRAVTGN